MGTYRVFKGLFLFILLIASAGTVTAQTDHMTLLAVAQDDEGNYSGSAADLELTVKKGEGRVYLETFPLSKIDTQISTRFAKEVACKLLNKDCSRYDFFYTIRSDASIIGGPSAGGSIAALTAAILDGKKVDQTITMTGTINSGDLIGPVGHIKEKILAAEEMGIETVLIPSGQRFEKIDVDNASLNSTNTTIDLIEFGNELDITVIEVIDLEDALYHFTGTDYSEELGELEVSQAYTEVMKSLAVDLCNQSKMILKEIGHLEIEDKNISKKYERGMNLTDDSRLAFDEESYYSAASYCFGAGVEFRRVLYSLNEMNSTELADLSGQIEEEMEEFNTDVDKKERSTITDLQAYMIVKERLWEAWEGLEFAENNSDALAYVKQRFYSAGSWSQFFGTNGRQFELTEENLKESCMEKLNELDERMQFVEIFFPSLMNGLRDNFQQAYDYFLNKEYALCLFKASKTKAEANVLVSVVGVGEEEFDKVLENKFLSAEKSIIKQTDLDVFPIIAYSYYEYGLSLKDNDKYSALIYAEYALELSNLDIYFEPKRPLELELEIDWTKAGILAIGFILGFLAAYIFARKRRVKKRTVHRKVRLK